MRLTFLVFSSASFLRGTLRQPSQEICARYSHSGGAAGTTSIPWFFALGSASFEDGAPSPWLGRSQLRAGFFSCPLATRDNKYSPDAALLCH
jgi:hypothetical protein